jgi:hypothetical protein
MTFKGGLFRGLDGELENRVVNRDIGLAFIDDGFLLVGRTLASRLDRKREVNSIDFFVVAESVSTSTLRPVRSADR